MLAILQYKNICGLEPSAVFQSCQSYTNTFSHNRVFSLNLHSSHFQIQNAHTSDCPPLTGHQEKCYLGFWWNSTYGLNMDICWISAAAWRLYLNSHCRHYMQPSLAWICWSVVLPHGQWDVKVLARNTLVHFRVYGFVVHERQLNRFSDAHKALTVLLLLLLLLLFKWA